MNANQLKSKFNQNEDAIFETHAKTLSQTSNEFCSSISKLNCNDQATEETSVAIKEILEEMQESTQYLIHNLTEFKREHLPH